MMTPDSELPSGGVHWDVLARYLAGEMSEHEAVDVRRWIDADPDRGAQVERLRAAWSAAGRLRGEWDTEAALARMLPTARPKSEPKPVIRLSERAGTTSRTGTRWHRVGGWAAAAMVVAAAGVGLLRSGVFAARPAAEAAIAPTEVATQRGQRASLRLPDGTDVMLGPESRVRYAVAGSRGARTVYLEGEAYFVVTHDAARPFTVHTAHAVATDLGTRFGVRAYPGDSVVNVAVAEGEVSLRPAGERVGRDRVLLARGDVGRVTRTGNVDAERGIALDRYLDWTAGRLVFRDTPLREAVVQLGRWYDVDIRLGDPALGAKRVTARFRKEPAMQAVALIAASLDLRVDAHDTVVVLRSR